MDIAPALGSGIQIETVNVPKKTYCGVDLNRNFPTKNWGNETADNGDMKTSKNPEDTEIYCGPDGGSEPETKAIVDFIKKNPVQGVLTLHSFGHQVLFPDAAVGDTFLQQIGNGMVSLMNSRGSSYKFDKGSGLYPTTGDMMDYSYEKGAFLSYTFELSPEGNAPIDQFFSGLPEAEIESTFKQNLPALLSLINCAGQASKKMATGGATVTPSSSPSTTVVQVVGDCWKAFDKWP